MVCDIVPGEGGESFGGAKSSDTEQFAEVCVGLSIFGPEHDRGAIDGIDFAPDEEGQFGVFCGGVCSDDSGESISIRDCESGVLEFFGGCKKFVGVRSPFEEGEIRLTMEFDVTYAGIFHTLLVYCIPSIAKVQTCCFLNEELPRSESSRVGVWDAEGWTVGFLA
jgi:hypothetical protein